MVDAIVVGSGPAGGMAAYRLASSGLQVLVLEKERLPREKVCGGGLQAKVLQEVPVDVGKIAEASCFGMAFTRRFQDGFVRRAERPLVYQVARSRFDYLLLEKAADAGAKILDGINVREVATEGELCRVRTTPQGDFSSRYVVFCDGVNGIGYKTLNSEERRFLQLGMEYDVPLQSDVGEYDTALASVEWGTMPDGYGWVFPKRDHLVIGCGGPRNQYKVLNEYLLAFAKVLGYRPEQCVNLRAHQIPSLSKGVVLGSEHMLLAGDAGGFVEPFAGEGISYAVRSGSLAAQAVISASTGMGSLGASYTASVEELVREIMILRRLKEFFSLVPQHVHRLYRWNDRVWEEFSRSLCGERAATVVRDNAPFAFLWPVIDAVASRVYEWRLGKRVELGKEYFEKLTCSGERHPAMRPVGGSEADGRIRATS